MKKYPLGRLPSPFDIRDYNLATFIPYGASMFTTEKTEMAWDFPTISLDQDNLPHCVGFSLAHFGINSPINTMYTKQDGHDFYYKCKFIDQRPYVEEGTYIRSGAKVLMNEKRIDAYAFARNLHDIKWWLLNRGPLIMGTIWTVEMYTPDKDNIVRIGGEVMGGHAYLINEWRSDNYIGIQNSWGEYWGDKGKAYISAEHLERLFSYQGEAMTAIELPHEEEEEKPVLPPEIGDATSSNTESGNWLLQLLKQLLDFLKNMLYN